jgi:hypothetical protein
MSLVIYRARPDPSPSMACRASGRPGTARRPLVPGLGWQFGPVVRHGPTRKGVGPCRAGPRRAGPDRARVVLGPPPPRRDERGAVTSKPPRARARAEREPDVKDPGGAYVQVWSSSVGVGSTWSRFTLLRRSKLELIDRGFQRRGRTSVAAE